MRKPLISMDLVKRSTPVGFFVVLAVLYAVVHYWLGIDSVRLTHIESSTYLAEEFYARTVWGLSLVGFCTVAIVGVLIAAYIYFSFPGGAFFTSKGPELAIVGAGFLIAFILIFNLKVLSISTGINIDLYEQAAGMNLLYGRECEEGCGIAAQGIIDGATVLVVMVITAIGLVLGKLLKGVGSASFEALEQTYHYYRLIFYTTAVVLVIGLIEVFFLSRWLEQVAILNEFLTVESATSETVANRLAQTKAVISNYTLIVSMGSAALYSGVFLVMFLPASLILRHRYLTLVAGMAFESEEAKASWEQQHAISGTPLERLRDFAVMMSPFITGMLANYIQ